MTNIKQMNNGIDRPMEIALLDAIHKAIFEVAGDKMTGPEIIGCLELIKLHFYADHYLTLED